MMSLLTKSAFLRTHAIYGSVALGSVLASVAPLAAAEDWREELLKDAKLGTDQESLRRLNDVHHKSAAELSKMIELLGADHVAVRTKAQNDLLRLGQEVLPQLQELPCPESAEARLRFANIQESLSRQELWSTPQLQRTAAAGLLYERENPGKVHPSRQMFVELFRQPAESLKHGYRRMKLQGAADLDGRVEDETLRFSGKRPQGEGDQRLSITAQEATGKKLFPQRFRIDVKLGGTAGGEGAYHVGVAVGKVRALFHPGLETGAFRFEQVGTQNELTTNAEIGFTPVAGSLVNMTIDVERQDKGSVKLAVALSDQNKTYRTTQVFEENQIGPIQQVSLDRSGRDGGDGLFRHLVMQFAQP